MSAGNAHEVVGMVELLRDVLSERITSTSRGDTPTASVIRIRPQKIADRAFMRDFLNSVKLLDLIEGIDTRREPSMEAEDGVVDDGSEGEVVEQLSEVHPDIGVSVLSEALIVEAVHLGDLTDFMVTSEDSQAVLEAHL